MTSEKLRDAQSDYHAAGLALAALVDARQRIAGCYAANLAEINAVVRALDAVRTARERALTTLHRLTEEEQASTRGALSRRAALVAAEETNG